MPITITIPNREFFDQVNNRFFTIKGRNLTFEHSLLSITKWESRWHKPYLSKAEKTKEEAIDYLRCMCLDKDVDPKIFMAIDVQSMKEITSYIENPMTATTFRDDNKKPNREIITNEIVYYWMTELNIPFEPCQKWHFNRLMTLIRVASIKKQPPKKMGKKEAASQRMALNAQRRAKYHSNG